MSNMKQPYTLHCTWASPDEFVIVMCHNIVRPIHVINWCYHQSNMLYSQL